MAHTLLLADDSVTIQRVIELTFADEDVRVVAVGDGDRAIASLEASPPDIVLADIGMPGKNGYEVAQYIHDSPRLAHIPVLLLAGAFEPVDEERASRVGSDGVLAKPFEPQLVIGRVKELLGRRKVVPAPAAATPSREGQGAPRGERGAVRGPLVPGSAEADRSFDRIDAAFASLGDPTSASAAPSALGSERIDWFAATPAEALDADLPLVDSPEPVSSRSPVASPPAAAPPAAAASFPPLADAFAALLAAEQSAPSPSATPSWPAQAAADPPAVSEELVAEVARRVLESLPPQVMREAIADLVSSVAERLVTEEIERIKNSIK